METKEFFKGKKDKERKTKRKRKKFGNEKRDFKIKKGKKKF